MAEKTASFVRTLVASEHSPNEALQASYELRVVSGPAQGRHIGPIAETVSLGSGKAASIRLEDPSVSRHHARIELGDDGVRIIDLESTNGTYINGVRISTAYLERGAVIRLGSSEIVFEMTGAFASVPISTATQFGRLVGKSLLMRRLFAVLERAAQTQSTVLIQGESGTGKELIAEALHDHSPWKDGPFVVVDCSSLPATLVESELFGHERGAFTGAVETRPGAFERAHGGTLFLDEIGELDLAHQPRLLRALENRRTRRVGSNKYRSFDVRFVAATNRDLQKMVSTSDFREDLYHRLSVIGVHSPPLRHRIDDLELLADRFLAELVSEDSERRRAVLTEEVIQSLKRRRWPGNVRELRNFLERLVTIGHASTELVNTNEHPSSSPHGLADALYDLPYAQAREQSIASFEKEYVRRALDRSGWNVARAARNIGIARVYLFRLIRRHGLRRRD